MPCSCVVTYTACAALPGLLVMVAQRALCIRKALLHMDCYKGSNCSLACLRFCLWVLMVPVKHLPRFNARRASGFIRRKMLFHNVCYQTILIAPIQRALAVFPSILLGGDDGLQCIGKDQIRNSAGRLCNVRRGLRFCRRNRLCGIGCGILRFREHTAGAQDKAQREQKRKERDALKN